jgi:hypothetical protein
VTPSSTLAVPEKLLNFGEFIGKMIFRDFTF